MRPKLMSISSVQSTTPYVANDGCSFKPVDASSKASLAAVDEVQAVVLHVEPDHIATQNSLGQNYLKISVYLARLVPDIHGLS